MALLVEALRAGGELLVAPRQGSEERQRLLQANILAQLGLLKRAQATPADGLHSFTVTDEGRRLWIKARAQTRSS